LAIVNYNVISIGNYAFRNCSALTSITIPNSVSSIGSYAFAFTGLTSITVPDSVISIASYAFAGCRALTGITLPFVGTSKTEIGGPYALFGVIFGRDNYTGGTRAVQWFRAYFGSVYTYDYIDYYIPASLRTVIITDASALRSGAFSNCVALTGITISGSVSDIGDRAFYNCGALANVAIPALVTSMGESAFYGCGSLTDIYYAGSEGQWNAVSGLAEAYIPEGATIAYNHAGG